MPFDHIFLDEFPPTYHGRCYTSPFNVIVIKNEVNMDQCENDKSPHQQVMDLAHMHIPAEERHHPCKQLWEE